MASTIGHLAWSDLPPERHMQNLSKRLCGDEYIYMYETTLASFGVCSVFNILHTHPAAAGMGIALGSTGQLDY